jgi:hypothetical protein
MPPRKKQATKSKIGNSKQPTHVHVCLLERLELLYQLVPQHLARGKHGPDNGVGISTASLEKYQSLSVG